MDSQPSEILEQMFSSLEPALWIANFKDGTSISSKNGLEFLDIPFEKRKEITALRLKLDGKNYTISRKVNDELVDGFFYHIKAGRKGMMGFFQGRNIPFVEERIGFCYNSNGDALTIKLDHGGFVVATHKRFMKMRDILTVDPNISDEELEKKLGRNINFRTELLNFRENIAFKDYFVDGVATVKVGPSEFRNSFAVNVARFGRLEELDELGTPPHVKIDSEESVLGQNRI
jgi:hypothetical protein